jgi:AcrR family transcriptional regulator
MAQQERLVITATNPRAPRRTRNPRGEGDRLRDDLIDVAAAAIAESGNANDLSLREVARRLGISAPSIYRHFPDVEHLKLAVVERAFSQFSKERDAARRDIHDPLLALLAGCRAYCEFATEHPGEYRFMFSPESPAQGRQSPAGAAALASLEASIHRCQEAGVATASADARTLAVELWAALHGLALLRLNVPDFDWPASLETMTERVVERLIQLNNTKE